MRQSETPKGSRVPTTRGSTNIPTALRRSSQLVRWLTVQLEGVWVGGLVAGCAGCGGVGGHHVCWSVLRPRFNRDSKQGLCVGRLRTAQEVDAWHNQESKTRTALMQVAQWWIVGSWTCPSRGQGGPCHQTAWLSCLVTWAPVTLGHSLAASGGAGHTTGTVPQQATVEVTVLQRTACA